MARIAFVVSEFNYDITSKMLERARAHAEFLEAEEGPVVWVPGSFDMGLPIKRLLERKDVDAVVAIGCVIQGDTGHDQLVAMHASRKIADLALESGKPVILAITGPGMTRMQAEARIDKGKEGVESALKMLKTLASISEPAPARARRAP